jgi:hypothetical protein
VNIGVFLSTLGGSPLQVGLMRGLSELGHAVSWFEPSYGYDLVLVFNQCAHATDYVYPDFPDACVPVAFIDSAEYGYFKRLPGVIGDYANTFSAGAMAHDTKNLHEQTRLRRFLEGRSFPYFIREFSRYIDYPAMYHPIDYPLYAGSACYERPNRDEYLGRQQDLFVSWGASHPWRRSITEALRGCSCKSEIRVLNDQAGEQVPRMPQSEFFARTRGAKASVSFDGYGSGSFRMTEVLVRTLLLQGPLSIVTRAPLVDGETCVMYAVGSDGETFLGTNICERLRAALADPEGSYAIHERGYHHCMEHLTERATAAALLATIEAHDWGVPTPLDM